MTGGNKLDTSDWNVNQVCCPHGIALAAFCRHLHITLPTDVTTSKTACPHGVELDKFCKELHDGHGREWG